MPACNDLRKYECGGISLLLPSGIKVKKDCPNFFAESREMFIGLSLNPDLQVRKTWEGIFQQPQGSNSMLTVTVVRDGNISLPYPGYERILESRPVGRDECSVHWTAILYPPSAFLRVGMGAKGTFAEKQASWQKIFDSIRVTDKA